MNISNRLAALERYSNKKPAHGLPLRPMDWTEGECLAVIKGLGITGYPLLTLLNTKFRAKYERYIVQIRDNYNEQGLVPDVPLVQAEPTNFFYPPEYIKPDKIPALIKRQMAE